MSRMGKEMKVCLPLYKVLYSLAFAVILSIARGVTHTYEVGIACEAPMRSLRPCSARILMYRRSQAAGPRCGGCIR